MFRRTLAALAAFGFVAACNNGSDTSDLDATFSTYLPWESSRDGVETGMAGLEYIVLKEGPEDGASPVPTDMVRVHYEGRTAAGDKFDSSYDRGSPSMFRLNQVIPGWTQGLQLMSEGDEYVFYIPSEIGYGQNPRPGSKIKPGDDLIFRVKLEKVFVPKPADEAAWDKYTPWDSSNEDVQKTDSGLEYVILESGSEDGAKPLPSDTVVVLYEGRFAESGEVFDSAYQRGEPIMFSASGVIPGWKEALSMMRPGDHWLLHVPSDIAYGERGHPAGIPPNADLNFEVELIDVLKTQ